jgi:hypothetical protein
MAFRRIVTSGVYPCRTAFRVRNAAAFVPCRDLTTESDKSKPEQSGWFGKITGHLTPPRLKTAAAGGAVLFIGASTVLYEVGSGFMKLTPYATGYYGFIIGVATTGGASFAFNKFVSLLYLAPSTVKSRVVDLMKVNTFVQHAFNGDIMVSDMTGYRTGTGHLTVKNRSVVWSPTFVEIVISVRGANNVEGVVTAVATKSWRGADLQSVCVHMEHMEPKFIVGTDQSISYHKKLAETVSLKMA